MRWLVAGLFVVFAVACAAQRQAQRAQFRQAIIDSWRGVDLIVLERHPNFAHLSPAVRRLSDGTETWVYTKCLSSAFTMGSTAPLVDGNVRGGTFGASRTSYRQDCCYSQFYIGSTPAGNQQVLSYRPVNCRLHCGVSAGGCAQ